MLFFKFYLAIAATIFILLLISFDYTSKNIKEIISFIIGAIIASTLWILLAIVLFNKYLKEN